MDTERDKTEKSPVALDILAYMYENPGAQGTLEAIIEWWLLEQKIERGTAMVKDAITELVNRGLIIEHKGMDERVRYQINRGKLDEIAHMLDQATGEDERP